MALGGAGYSPAPDALNTLVGVYVAGALEAKVSGGQSAHYSRLVLWAA